MLHLSGIPDQMLLKPTTYGVAGEPGERIPLGRNDSCDHPWLVGQATVITNKTRLCASSQFAYLLGYAVRSWHAGSSERNTLTERIIRTT